MSIADTFSASFKSDWTRYLRSKSLWFVALAAPIAAHFMVPDKEASYAVLSINQMIPVLTAPVLGLELGVLTATLLTPLAYIFLRAGPTRHRPWQISDVAPHSRMIATLGRWVADTAALWILVAALTIAGFILGLFRLEADSNAVQTIWALWLPAAPSLALIAAVRLLLDARNWTRRWLGDVMFFIIWCGLLVTGLIGSTDPQTGAMTAEPFKDAFGFVAPIVGSVDVPVEFVSIGGGYNTGESMRIDGWQGVTDGAYVMSRLFWLGLAAGLAAFAGLIWSPMKQRKSAMRKAEATNAAAQSRIPISDIGFVAPPAVQAGTLGLAKVVRSNILLLLRSKAWFICLCLTAIAGAVLPFREMAGPAILLALIFPLTDESARWEAPTTGQLLATMGAERGNRMLSLFIASVLVAGAVLLPAAIRAIMVGDAAAFPHMAIIAFGAPAVAIMLGSLTRSAVAGRLILLIIWYVYLSSAGV